MPRPQFSLKTLLWLMSVVAAFCGGAAWQRLADQSERGRLRAERDYMADRAKSADEAIETLNKDLDFLAKRKFPTKSSD